MQLLQKKVNINAVNEHGNTPLHYACFWNHEFIAEDLINNGALVSISNRFDETPLDKAKTTMKPITLGPNFTGAPDNTMNTSYSKF